MLPTALTTTGVASTIVRYAHLDNSAVHEVMKIAREIFDVVAVTQNSENDNIPDPSLEDY